MARPITNATYKGKPCRKCGSTVRLSSTKSCLDCRTAYLSRPDVKERRRNTAHAYNRRPENQARKREHHLKTLYGLSLEAYEALHTSQDGKCAICEGDLITRTHVDHNHASGAVRGLLCAPCNRAIGMLQDNPTICRNAAEYLERHS